MDGALHQSLLWSPNRLIPQPRSRPKAGATMGSVGISGFADRCCATRSSQGKALHNRICTMRQRAMCVLRVGSAIDGSVSTAEVCPRTFSPGGRVGLAQGSGWPVLSRLIQAPALQAQARTHVRVYFAEALQLASENSSSGCLQKPSARLR
jgi:hypothetical protein